MTEEVSAYYLRQGREMVDALSQFGIVDVTKRTQEVDSIIAEYIGYIIQSLAGAAIKGYKLSESVKRLKQAK